MLSASYQAGPALIGAIFGTGTNGAYLEDLTNITKLGADFIKEQAVKTGPKMIINAEWGALDNNVSSRTTSLLFDALELASKLIFLVLASSSFPSAIRSSLHCVRRKAGSRE